MQDLHGAPTSAVAWVDQIIADALAKRASDIHLEPHDRHLQVRLRIDGLLEHHTTAPKHQAEAIIARIKVMASLDIGQRRLPQDGRLRFISTNQQQPHEFRVSSCPTLFGEKMVLRHVDTLLDLPPLDQLGLDKSQHRLLLEAIEAPWGLILVTGPTGSGKTVTLYSALSHLNQAHRNISTIEDPIEMSIPGINQVAHHEAIGMTFAHVLRAFLRQDPDIIMIGEIRDPTTAKIAVQAAQTGHLVLSTLHTNTAMASLTRLKHLGIPAHDLAGALRLILAQSLMRKLHTCKTIDHSKQAKAITARYPGTTVYEASHCPGCRQGYLGRMGVFETLPITPCLRQGLAESLHKEALLLQAKEEGFVHLPDAALAHVIAGRTSLREMRRTTADVERFNSQSLKSTPVTAID